MVKKIQGRPKNNNLPRQQGFKLLNANMRKPRAEMLSQLQFQLQIGRSYAENLHAEWRTNLKEQGILHTIYTVKDIKSGKPVAPYIIARNVFDVTNNDSVTITAAKEKYQKRLSKNQLILNSL